MLRRELLDIAIGLGGEVESPISDSLGWYIGVRRQECRRSTGRLKVAPPVRPVLADDVSPPPPAILHFMDAHASSPIWIRVLLRRGENRTTAPEGTGESLFLPAESPLVSVNEQMRTPGPDLHHQGRRDAPNQEPAQAGAPREGSGTVYPS